MEFFNLKVKEITVKSKIKFMFKTLWNMLDLRQFLNASFRDFE